MTRSVKRQDPSPATIGRLSLYRVILNRLLEAGQTNIFSHQLAELANCTPSQVRRDLMAVSYFGSAVHGYDIRRLIDGISAVLDAPVLEGVALIGVGNIGRAVLAFFRGRRPNLRILAAFDRDPLKVNRLYEGVRCYPMEDLERMAREKDIRLAIIAVPASEAQSVAEAAVRAGVRGILNFAPIRLRLPKHVFVENLDMTISLEKVAFFARRLAETSTSKTE